MIRALALLFVFATPAAAGCDSFATTPPGSFREIDGRDGSFVMAVGTFSDGAVVDEIHALAADGSETSTRILASRFEGLSTGPEGFTVTFEVDLQVAQRCNSTGCHPRLDGTRYLVFLERVRGRYKFAEDGCAYRAYEQPTDVVLETMVSCLNGVCP